MKPRDGNDVLREDGEDALRAMFDSAAPYEIEHVNGPAPPHWGPAKGPKPRFIPVAIDDVRVSAEPAWLIDRILPARGLACIVGPPKSRKSFFTTDMFFAVARGAAYGERATLQGPVLYLTGEGVSGFRRRLIAMRRHYGVEGHGVPFFMIEQVPDLGSEKTDLDLLLRDLDLFMVQSRIPTPRAIVLDTLARCMGSGDENTARDMGRFVQCCSAIEQHFDCLIATVHHTGKDADRGGRGSNALNGAADVMMIIEKSDAFSTVRVTEIKDGPEGSEWRFRLLPMQLSETADTSSETLSDTTTCVVELMTDPTQAKQSETKSAKAPTGVAGDLLRVIRRAISDTGELHAAGMPAGVPSVTREMLKSYCRTMAWQSERDADAFRSVFSSNLSNLRSKGLIDFDRERVWIT